jgi:uncharacterized protein YndB with AHSA1/START domain
LNLNEPVEASVRIGASAKALFPYFTVADQLMKWMGVSAELDPRPGGAYRVNVTGKNIAVGEFVEVTPDSRVVFTWGWEDSELVAPGTSTVEVSLVEDGDETVVTLRHLDLVGEQAEMHKQGWEHYLSRLAIAGIGGDAGHDPFRDGA